LFARCPKSHASQISSANVILIAAFAEQFDCLIGCDRTILHCRLISMVLHLLLQCKQDGVISSADWKVDPQELASKFNSKTKMIIINNPNNPLGKV